jgi:hypothetical protein
VFHSHPLRHILVALAGWINQQHRGVIDDLQEDIVYCASSSGPSGFDSRTTTG